MTRIGPLRRIAGLIGGATLGLLAGFLFVWGWTALDLPAWSSDPKALDQLLICSVAGLVIGGWIGATRLARAPAGMLAATAIVGVALIAAFLGLA